MSSIEHVNVKLFAREPAFINWPDLIPVFHRWIQQQAFPEAMLIDVADYAHVPAGPGVMLIGHHANISIDNRKNRIGMLYNRKSALEGSNVDKLRHSYDGARRAAKKLEQEPEFGGKISFDEGDIEITVNDRVLAPNTAETWEILRRDFEAVFGSNADFEQNGTARELFRVWVRVTNPALAGITVADSSP